MSSLVNEWICAGNKEPLPGKVEKAPICPNGEIGKEVFKYILPLGYSS